MERVFRIEASQFAYNPGEIRVNPGDTVTIELISTDVVHGLYVDGYGELTMVRVSRVSPSGPTI